MRKQTFVLDPEAPRRSPGDYLSAPDRIPPAVSANISLLRQRVTAVDYCLLPPPQLYAILQLQPQPGAQFYRELGQLLGQFKLAIMPAWYPPDLADYDLLGITARPDLNNDPAMQEFLRLQSSRVKLPYDLQRSFNACLELLNNYRELGYVFAYLAAICPQKLNVAQCQCLRRWISQRPLPAEGRRYLKACYSMVSEHRLYRFDPQSITPPDLDLAPRVDLDLAELGRLNQTRVAISQDYPHRQQLAVLNRRQAAATAGRGNFRLRSDVDASGLWKTWRLSRSQQWELSWTVLDDFSGTYRTWLQAMKALCPTITSATDDPGTAWCFTTKKPDAARAFAPMLYPCPRPDRDTAAPPESEILPPGDFIAAVTDRTAARQAWLFTAYALLQYFLPALNPEPLPPVETRRRMLRALFTSADGELWDVLTSLEQALFAPIDSFVTTKDQAVLRGLASAPEVLHFWLSKGDDRYGNNVGTRIQVAWLFCARVITGERRYQDWDIDRRLTLIDVGAILLAGNLTSCVMNRRLDYGHSLLAREERPEFFNLFLGQVLYRSSSSDPTTRLRHNVTLIKRALRAALRYADCIRGSAFAADALRWGSCLFQDEAVVKFRQKLLGTQFCSWEDLTAALQLPPTEDALAQADGIYTVLSALGCCADPDPYLPVEWPGMKITVHEPVVMQNMQPPAVMYECGQILCALFLFRKSPCPRLPVKVTGLLYEQALLNVLDPQEKAALKWPRQHCEHALATLPRAADLKPAQRAAIEAALAYQCRAKNPPAWLKYLQLLINNSGTGKPARNQAPLVDRAALARMTALPVIPGMKAGYRRRAPDQPALQLDHDLIERRWHESQEAADFIGSLQEETAPPAGPAAGVTPVSAPASGGPLPPSAELRQLLQALAGFPDGQLDAAAWGQLCARGQFMSPEAAVVELNDWSFAAFDAALVEEDPDEHRYYLNVDLLRKVQESGG